MLIKSKQCPSQCSLLINFTHMLGFYIKFMCMHTLQLKRSKFFFACKKYDCLGKDTELIKVIASLCLIKSIFQFEQVHLPFKSCFNLK